MLTLTLPRGTSRDFDLQAVFVDGQNAVDTFVSTDTITATVWTGDDQASLLAPSAAWISASLGTYRVTFNDANTSSFSPQIYRMQVKVARSGRSVVIGDFGLEITSTPGTGAAPLCWCTFDDLARFAPWLSTLQEASDGAGFVEQRARATQWAIETALARVQDISEEQYQRHEPLNPTSFEWPDSGIDLGPDFVRSTYWEPNTQDALTSFRTLLNTAGSVTLESRLVESVARMAIAYVCSAQLGQNQESSYQQLAADFRRQAISLLFGYTFRVATPTDTDHPERVIAG